MKWVGECAPPGQQVRVNMVQGIGNCQRADAAHHLPGVRLIACTHAGTYCDPKTRVQMVAAQQPKQIGVDTLRTAVRASWHASLALTAWAAANNGG